MLVACSKAEFLMHSPFIKASHAAKRRHRLVDLPAVLERRVADRPFYHINLPEIGDLLAQRSSEIRDELRRANFSPVKRHMLQIEPEHRL